MATRARLTCAFHAKIFQAFPQLRDAGGYGLYHDVSGMQADLIRFLRTVWFRMRRDVKLCSRKLVRFVAREIMNPTELRGAAAARPGVRRD